MISSKEFILYLIVCIGMLPVFNTGFNACIDEEARDSFKSFKLFMYTILLVSAISAFLSIKYPLFMIIYNGASLFFLLIAGMLNICSLYRPD